MLEYLKGTPLSDAVNGDALLPSMQVVSIVAKVARALHHAHEHGVIHRDMKPANVMLLKSGEPKILDFGVAKLEGGQLTVAGQFFGSPLYMSPEQALANPADARSDIFSLGSILYALLTGRHPFAADSVPVILTRVVRDDPPSPSKVVPGLPEGLDYVVARALAKQPDNRYGSAEAMAEDLEDVAAGRDPRHRAGWTPTVAERTMTSGSRERIPAMAAAKDAAGAAGGDPLDELQSLIEDAPVPHAPRSAETYRGAASAKPQVRRAPFPSGAPAARSATQRRGTGFGRSGWWAAAVVAIVVLGGGLAPFPARWRALRPAGTRVGGPAITEEGAVPSGKAELALVLQHFGRKGHLRVWIDDELALDTEIRAQEARKLVAVTIREGRFTDTLPVAAGKHEIRVEVEWDDNRRVLNTFANFPSDSARTLELELVRITRNLKADWR